MTTLLLASASPRRSALLRSAGVAFRVEPAAVDESLRGKELPVPYVNRVARDKAQAVAARFPGHPVLAADTTVELEGEILGKPVDEVHARLLLTRLSGRTHAVHTSVYLLLPHGEHARVVVSTAVTFRALTPGDIARHVATGEAYDKAGGYGIQGEGGSLVDKVSGSYTNVVGLPLPETLDLLRAHGVGG